MHCINPRFAYLLTFTPGLNLPLSHLFHLRADSADYHADRFFQAVLVSVSSTSFSLHFA